jgi:hypothetical protein
MGGDFKIIKFFRLWLPFLYPVYQPLIYIIIELSNDNDKRLII